MKRVLPTYIKNESIISMSSECKPNGWNYCRDEEDKREYPYVVVWEKKGFTCVTVLACLCSEDFGGNCLCRNHKPYEDYEECTPGLVKLMTDGYIMEKIII